MNWFRSEYTELRDLLKEYKDMNGILKEDKKELQAIVDILKQHQSSMSRTMYETEKKMLSLTHLVGDITETILTINNTHKEKGVYSEEQVMELVKFASQKATSIVKNGDDYARRVIEKVVKEVKNPEEKNEGNQND